MISFKDISVSQRLNCSLDIFFLLGILFYFIFISLIFIFHIILYSFKETPPRQLFPGAIPWRSTNTENCDIRASNLKGHKSVSTSVIPSRRRWSRTSNPFAGLSLGEKKMEPNQLLLIWCIWSWLIWVSVEVLMTMFWFL